MATACTNGIDTGFVSLGYAKVVVLGIVQGVAELMPIRSTAHMHIVQALLRERRNPRRYLGGWLDFSCSGLTARPTMSTAIPMAIPTGENGLFWRDGCFGADSDRAAAIQRRKLFWRDRYAAVGGIAKSGQRRGVLLAGPQLLRDSRLRQRDRCRGEIRGDRREEFRFTINGWARFQAGKRITTTVSLRSESEGIEEAVQLNPSNIAARRNLEEYCLQAPWWLEETRTKPRHRWRRSQH